MNMYKGVSKTHYNQEFDATNLMRCWDECMRKSSYVNRRNKVQLFNKENYWKKRGLAIIPLKFTVGFVEKMYHQVCVSIFKCVSSSFLAYGKRLQGFLAGMERTHGLFS